MSNLLVRHVIAAMALVTGSGLLGLGCFASDNCEDTLSCPTGTTSATASGGAGSGATGPGGTAGAGGMTGCQSDADCTSPTAAKCEGETCVPCDDSAQCMHLAGTTVCDAGTCVECMLGDEDACTGGETCDLLAKACVNVAAGSVANCNACTNDVQCVSGHRCIAMDFQGSPHGHYCLDQQMPTCGQPYAVTINMASISGAAAVDYCGINENLATCEAVLALFNNWRCSGNNGMCSPDGIQPEVAVPGALCRQVGALANRCTYACAGTSECLDPPTAGNTCGGTPTPTWCGG